MAGVLERLSWDDLKLFSAVARTGNFTRAAHEQRLTGTTVGRRMQRLERDIGMKLFVHSGTDAHLTDDGKRVLAHIQAAVHAIALASSPAPIESTVCRVMCSDGLASYWLPQFLPAFMERHPNIDLTIFSTPDRYSTRLPIFDLKVQYTESGSEDLVCARVGTMHFMLFAAERYVRTHGTITNLTELSEHKLLDLALDITGQGNLSAWTKLPFHNAILTNVNGALSEAVRHGAGIGLLPSFAKLFEPSLVPILPNFRLPTPLYICYDRENAKRVSVRAVLDYMRGTVFAPTKMPWFRDPSETPDATWLGLYREVLAELYPKATRQRAKPPRAKTHS